MEIVNIPKTEKRYRDEWLLFEVIEENETEAPIKGTLLAHSPSRAAVYEIMLKLKKDYVYMVYTGSRPKKGIVSIL